MQPFAIAIIFVCLYLAEHVLPQRKLVNDYRHDLFNIAIGLVNLIAAAAGGYSIQWLLTRLYDCHFGLLYYLPGHWIFQLLTGLLLIDFFMYWWHRANHQFSFFWYFHRFHHVDKNMNTTSSVRFHTVELLLSYVFKIPVFALLGISAGTLALYGLLLFSIITFHHSNILISDKTDFIFRKFFVSPKMHRIHHSVIRRETDSNFSSILPYWDRLFGSYNHVPEHPIEFGV